MWRFLAVSLLAGCSSLLPKANPFPDITVVSPGVKAGYTFGRGWTWGGELTVVRKTWDDLHAIVAAGPAVNFTWAPRYFEARFGAEAVSWFAGLEGGISVVKDRAGSHVGFGISPWLGGIIVVPYYTHVFVRGSDDHSEIGSYFKLPLCFTCSGGHGDLDFHH
jgi:hypothetical protein